METGQAGSQGVSVKPLRTNWRQPSDTHMPSPALKPKAPFGYGELVPEEDWLQGAQHSELRPHWISGLSPQSRRTLSRTGHPPPGLSPTRVTSPVGCSLWESVTPWLGHGLGINSSK